MGGLAGLALAGIQFLILHQTCALCLTVDATAMLLAALAASGGHTSQPRAGYVGCLVWGGLGTCAALAPLLWWGLNPVVSAPAQIRALWVPGKVSVIEITDFTCPHCRNTHWALRQALAEQEKHGTALHLVRLAVPLPHHANARIAVKTYMCAARQNRCEPMADALFQAPDLSPASLRTLAQRVGLDLKEYDDCMDSTELDKQIDQTRQWVQASHPGGLPAIWIQDELLSGIQTTAGLEAAFERLHAVR
jgi:predicted DsbA family dithiol-disulfide isomerase